MVGTFYRSPSPGSPSFVEVGQNVKVGDVVCIVEAMKMQTAIHAHRDGLVGEITAPVGTRVDSKDLLMVLRSSGSKWKLKFKVQIQLKKVVQ